MSSNNTAPLLECHDQYYCLHELSELIDEIETFPRFVGSITLLDQVNHCIKCVRDNEPYAARMSLYQVQNRLSSLEYSSRDLTGNIGYLRSLLKCFSAMSEAGRPLGHTLAPNAAVPYRIENIKKGVTYEQ